MPSCASDTGSVGSQVRPVLEGLVGNRVCSLGSLFSPVTSFVYFAPSLRDVPRWIPRRERNRRVTAEGASVGAHGRRQPTRQNAGQAGRYVRRESSAV